MEKIDYESQYRQNSIRADELPPPREHGAPVIKSRATV
jgi:hypothetical protein